MELLDVGRSALNGVLLIVNRLPCGAGLGASAALCVALARWLEARGLVSSGAIHEFARQLENLFHGESSGLDIAVALRERPVMFCADFRRVGIQTGMDPGIVPVGQRRALRYPGVRRQGEGPVAAISRGRRKHRRRHAQCGGPVRGIAARRPPGSACASSCGSHQSRVSLFSPLGSHRTAACRSHGRPDACRCERNQAHRRGRWRLCLELVEQPSAGTMLRDRLIPCFSPAP